MDNINNNITRFNGQYLKCIVSNYTSTKNYLGNSGSLIIIQPKSGKLNDIEWETAYNNGDIHRNYVYLGNEFLASGFGFASQRILEKAEHIVNVYDDDIESLRQKDIALDKKIDDEIEIINEKLNQYVKINGGHIENTVVALNGQLIKTKDIILYGEEAQYKNLEVNEVKISIDNNECDGDTIFLPMGSYLNKVNVELEIAKNDSGGILDLEVLHRLDNDEYEGTKIKYDLDSDITINEDYDIYRLFYEKELSENDTFIVDSYKPEVLKSIYVTVKGTPESAYKCYPGIYRKFNIKIISSGNAIRNNILNLNKIINIRPQYYIKYSQNGILEDDDFTGMLLLNSFKDYDKTTVSFNITNSMAHNRAGEGFAYIAVPSNFSISKIYVVRNHSEKFNWTGAVRVIRNRKMKCLNNAEYSTQYYLDFDVYTLYASKGFIENTSIELEVVYNYIKDTTDIDGDYDNLPVDHINANEILSNTNDVEILNDEDFNDLYWLNYKKIYNSEYNKLVDKLDTVSINGAELN